VKSETSTIQFKNFLISESHIKYNKPGKINLDISFKAAGKVIQEISEFRLYLDTIIRDEETDFLIDVKSVSRFSYPDDANLSEYTDSYFTLNAPAIVFPYIRAYISGLTALSGMATLTLPTFNLSALGEELKHKIEIS
jgi:preprotein translocase subunit SecB